MHRPARGPAAVLAAAAAAWALGACARDPAGPNLVIVSVDTLRPDRLSYNGHARATSPTLDALAREGVVFERCYSQSGWTLPSMATVLTGRHPRQHGAIDFGRRIDPALPTLASLLGAEGYETLAFVSHVLLTPATGMDTGFETFDDSVLDVGHPHEVSTGKQLTDLALAALERTREPFFLWVHYFDPHWVYQDHAAWDFGSTGSDRYEEEIAYTDLEIARLLGGLDAKGVRARTAIAFVADHGEEFGEHGGYQHQTLHDEVTRVPLILVAPSLAPARVAAPVQQVDLLPTLLALVGAPVPAGLPGIDLLAGVPAGRPVFLERDRPVEYRQRSVVAWPYKLTLVEPVDVSGYPPGLPRDKPEAIAHVVPGAFLYDLAADPGETVNLYAESHPQALELTRLLREHFADDRGLAGDAAEIDARLLQQLDQLGYVEGR
jgi:arylsulfatase A-like enzyme